MKKIFSLLIVSIIITSMLFSITGCGTKKLSQVRNEEITSDGNHALGISYDAAPEDAEIEQTSSPETPTALPKAGVQSPLDILGDRKIIFNAYVVMEVEEFDTKMRMIKSMVEDSGIGYIQSSHTSSHKYSSDPEYYRKEGTIVLRVSQDKFYGVIENLEELGTILDNRMFTEEITDQYYDTKYRTQMYEAERERIMQYLKQANDLNAMLQLERKLSEVTYEIERLKGSLRKWDNLVDFATITVELKEKVPEKIASKNGLKNYGRRLIDALGDSFIGTIEAIGDFVIIIVSLLPIILLIGIIYLVARPFIKRYRDKKNKTIEE